MDRLIYALIYAIRQAYYGNGSSVTYAPGNCAPNGTQAVLCSAGDMLIPVSNLATSTTVTVNAYGSPDYSIYPHMQVIVAGRVIGEWDVSATSQDYTVALPGLPTFALLAESVDYLPFGELMGWGSGATHLFTGDERDSETGLDHTLFRQYSSSLGRWSSPDPLAGDISDPQSLNRYAYVGNNPLAYTDPLGAAPCGDDSTPCPLPMENGLFAGSNTDFVQWSQVPTQVLAIVSKYAWGPIYLVNGNSVYMYDEQGRPLYSDDVAQTFSGVGNRYGFVSLWTYGPAAAFYSSGGGGSSQGSGSNAGGPTPSQYLQAIGGALAPLNRLSDCAGEAVANQVPFGDKLLGTPKSPSDPVGTMLDVTEKLSDNKASALVVLGLNKAGLPALSEAVENVATKIVPKVAPYAQSLSVLGWAHAGYSAIHDTATCYNKQGN